MGLGGVAHSPSWPVVEGSPSASQVSTPQQPSHTVLPSPNLCRLWAVNQSMFATSQWGVMGFGRPSNENRPGGGGSTRHAYATGPGHRRPYDRALAPTLPSRCPGCSAASRPTGPGPAGSSPQRWPIPVMGFMRWRWGARSRLCQSIIWFSPLRPESLAAPTGFWGLRSPDLMGVVDRGLGDVPRI